MAPAVLLELALALAQPALPPLRARHDPRRVELERHLLGCLRLRLPGRLALRLLAELPGVGVIVAQPLPGLAEELASALRRAQPLGQLIATRLAIELVLGLVGRPASATTTLAIRSNS